MIGLGFLVGTVLSVATAAATVGLASLAIFAVGMLPTVYSTGLSLMAFMAADEATSHLFSDDVKAFVGSETALVSEAVLIVGGAAAGAAVAQAVKSPAQWAQRLVARLAPRPVPAQAATSHNIAPKRMINTAVHKESMAKARVEKDARIAEVQAKEAAELLKRQQELAAQRAAEAAKREQDVQRARAAAFQRRLEQIEAYEDGKVERGWEKLLASIVSHGDQSSGIGGTHRVSGLVQNTKDRVFSNGVVIRPDLAKKVQPLLQEIDRVTGEGKGVTNIRVGSNLALIRDLNDLLVAHVGSRNLSHEAKRQLERRITTVNLKY
jgi:hypothetical protein